MHIHIKKHVSGQKTDKIMHMGNNKEDRLEQILRLREYQQNNARDVNVMAGIISPCGEYSDSRTEEEDQDQTKASGRIFRKLRLVLCLLLFGAVWIYHFQLEPEDGTFTKKLQSSIQLDYSGQVVDFVKNIII